MLVVGVPDDKVVEVGEEFIVGYSPAVFLSRSRHCKHGRRPFAESQQRFFKDVIGGGPLIMDP